MGNEQLKIVQKDCADLLSDGHKALRALKGDRVLITGGTGFVGIWLTTMIAFLNDNYGFGTKITLLSTQAGSFFEKVPHLVGRKDIDLIERDVRSIVEFPEDVSWIIHAAGSPDSRFHVSAPLHTIDVIVNGTSTVMSTATRLSNLKNVLNVSSGLVYGSQSIGTESIAEDSWGVLNPTSVGSVYAEAKRCAESVCEAYRNENRMPIVNVRPFAFVGPYQPLDKPWAINNFIRDALLGGPIRILGDEQTVRSYLYASDMAFWMLRVLVDGKSGQSFNLGSPEPVSLGELAKKIASNISEGIEVRHSFVHKDVLTRSRFIPDIARLKNSFDLHPTVNLDEAIKRTLLWNKQHA